MTQKPIDRLYGVPFVLINLIILVKYFDLFPIPSWVLVVVVLWGAIGFFVEAMRQRKKK
jgi:cytochrome c oxidase subunit IV